MITHHRLFLRLKKGIFDRGSVRIVRFCAKIGVYMTHLSVIVLSYNTKDVTRQCLDSLFETLSKNRLTSQIIVLDNASQDDSPKMLQELAKKLHDPHIEYKVIVNKQNVGYSAGNNQALKEAKGR